MAVNLSIKKNFVLSLVNTISGLLFPIITFPYVSRVLLADGIGQVQFFSSIISYITLLTSLGIPLYAIREIARVRDDHTLMSKTTIEILLLHTLLSLIGYVIVFILICTVTKIQADIPLFMLLSISILFSAIGVEWFYSGIEDFKYITIRSVLVKFFSLIALFIFVREKQDLYYYAAISVAGTVGSHLFNFFRLRKYVDIKEVKELNVYRHLKPSLKIFALNLIISLYVNLDTIMLGFLKDEQAVGFYAASTRLTKALLGIIASLGTVLLPRFSNLISTNQAEEFKRLAGKAIRFVMMLSLPLSTGLICLAKPIVFLFAGEHFEPSVLTLQILSPIILFIGLSGIIGMQILYPQGKENLVIKSTAVGAFLNFVLNLVLIPCYSQYGAALATVIAEFGVTFVMIIISKRYIPFAFFNKANLHFLIGSIVIWAIIIIIKQMFENDYIILFTSFILSVFAYFTYLYMVKDILVTETYHKVILFIRQKRNKSV